MKTVSHSIKRLLSMLLSVTLVLSLVQVSVSAKELGTSALTNFDLTFQQGGDTITSDSGVIIDSGKGLDVHCSFDVSLTDGNGNPCVETGDFATIEFPTWLTFEESSNIELKATFNKQEIVIGSVEFSDNQAKVTFDLSNEIFNEDVTELRGIWFEASMSAAAQGEDDSPVFTILDKTFTFPVEHTVNYTIKKTGALNDAKDAITWTVTADANYSDGKASLAGCTITDDLSAVGTYQSGTFKVDGVAIPPEYDSDNKALSYTFLEDYTGSKATLTFTTAFDRSDAYTTGSASVTNTAKLLDKEQSEKASDDDTVTYAPEWIKKSVTQCDVNGNSAAAYSPYYKWTIAVNPDGCALDGAKIKDPLPSALEFVSATLTIGEVTTSVVPTDSVYDLGNLTAPATLTIISKVKNLTPDGLPLGEIAADKLKNTATFYWDGSSKFEDSAQPSNNYGYAPISKSVAYNAAKRTATWTVNVNLHDQNYGENLQVLDLIVNGNTFDKANLTSATDVGGTSVLTDDLKTQVNAISIPDGMKNMTYEPGTFAAATGTPACTVYQLTDKNGATADLLVVTGLSTTDTKFTFDTLLTDKTVYAGNLQKIENTASLLNGTTRIQNASASKKVSYFLYKDVLSAANGIKLEDGKGEVSTVSSAGTKANCFNYENNSVYFRILVNADGVDYGGEYSCIDTLPAGWHFETIGTADADFLLYEGDTDTAKNGQGNIKLSGKVDAPSAVCTAEQGEAGNGAKTMSFKFTNLNKPYIIIVKAVMDDKTVNAFFAKNQEETFRNDVYSVIDSNTSAAPSDYEDFEVKSSVLGKIKNKVQDGLLEWTVDYHAYNLDHTAAEGETAQITDTLPQGIELRTDRDGKLVLGENITLTELKLNMDGTYSLGAEISGEDLEKLISYSPADRTLTLKLPDGAASYCLTYLTDITGEIGDISNTVSLETAKQKQNSVVQQYTITAADAGATLQFGGSFTVKKYGAGNALLPGAEFTLTNGTVLRKGITDANGLLKFKAVPVGSYTLTETKAPDGYSIDPTEYDVTVNDDRSISINGINENEIAITDVQTDSASLKLQKTVTGNAATLEDRATAFEFTVMLPGAAEDVYSYVGSGTANGTLHGGENTVNLASGQSITIINLPADEPYQITEKAYSGFVTTSTGADGTLESGVTSVAAFVNDKSTSSSESGNSGNSGTSTPSGGESTIPDGKPPLSGDPTDETDITDGETPLTGAPTDETEIADTSVPQSANPGKTGDMLTLWTAMTGVSGAGLLWLALSDYKRRKDTGAQ